MNLLASLRMVYATDSIGSIPAMSYETCVTIVLTALCAMLAILAVGIGALAIWGYSGFQEVRKSMEADVAKKADEALAAKLSEYPDAKSIIQVFDQFKEQSALMEQLRNQMTPTESNSVAEASNREQDKLAEQVSGSIADDYPTGQEARINAND